MRAIRLGANFEIYGDGNQVRDYVHVSDVVQAMRLALGNEEWRGPVVIGSGTSLSVHEVVQAVRDVSGAELPVGHGPAKPGEMPAVIVDNSRARSLGWVPQYPQLSDGLVGVWDEWSKADVEAPVAAGGGPA
jgi:UDP-glucose 4-epimerase